MTFSRKYRSSRNRPVRISDGQFLVRRREHADVDLHARRAADRLDHLLLQRPEHLRLRLQAHVADLVQEERAAIRQLELAAPIRDCAGKRPLDVAEQLRLDQLLRDRRAVDFDERPVPPAAHRVYRARDQLLPRPVLAVDQDAAVRGRRHRHLLAELRHDVAVAHHHQPAVDAGAQRAVLRFELAVAQRVADDEDGLLERQRLLDEVVRAELDRLDRRLDVAVAGDHDDDGVGAALAQTLQRREAVHAGQPDVEDDEVDRPARQPVQTLLAARHRLDDVPFVLEDTGQRRPHAGFVVNQKNCPSHV